MGEQFCMTCQWYDEWFGVCCCGDSQWCADCPAEPEATRCRFWATRDEGTEAVNTNMRLKLGKDLRADFSSGKAEDAGGLSPGKDDNAAWRKICRKDCRILVAY